VKKQSAGANMKTIKKVWAATWRIGVFFIGWAALTSVLIVPVLSKRVPHGGTISPELRLYVEMVSVAAVLLAAWLMLRFIDRRPFVSLGFAKKNAGRDLLVGLFIGLAMMASCVALLFAFEWARWRYLDSFAVAPLVLATIAMFLNTLTQEVLVRGYIQQTIQFRFGKLAGVLVSSLIFLGMHLGAIGTQVLPAISLFAAGVLLGTCYAVTDNLWLPIALHFGWNVLQGPVLGGTVSGQAVDAGNHMLDIAGPAIATGGKFGIEGGLIAVAITALATPLVVLLYRTRRVRS
jgi:membrane protease YdiL (CAAX protease family)